MEKSLQSAISHAKTLCYQGSWSEDESEYAIQAIEEIERVYNNLESLANNPTISADLKHYLSWILNK